MNPILQKSQKSWRARSSPTGVTCTSTLEIRDELPNTTKFVMEKLTEMGYEPKEICKGAASSPQWATLERCFCWGRYGCPPMEEDTDLEFRSCNSYAHTCGHDTHTAMLLGAAKILKEHEKELKGTVKLMFQPAGGDFHRRPGDD